MSAASAYSRRRSAPLSRSSKTALREASVYINGGQCGLQIELDPSDARRVLAAIVAALVVA